MASDTFHGYPLIVYTIFAALTSILVTTQLGILFANPELFLGSTVDDAAERLAVACDGKVNQVTLPAPPPSSRYFITSCAEQLEVSSVRGAIQIIQIGTALYDLGKSGKELAERVWNSAKKAEGFRDFLKVLNQKKIAVAVDDLEEVSSRLDDIGEALSDSKKFLDDTLSFTDEGSDIARDVDSVSSQVDTLSQRNEELANRIQEAKKQGKDFEIDCHKEPELCDYFANMDGALNDLSGNLDRIGSTLVSSRASALDSLKTEIKDLKKAFKKAEKLKDKKGISTISSQIATLKNERKSLKGQLSTVERLVKDMPSVSDDLTEISAFIGLQTMLSGSLAGIRSATKESIITRREYVDLINQDSNAIGSVLTYLGDEDVGLWELLSGTFVSIYYSPRIILVVNYTDPVLLDFYNDSLFVSGAFYDFGNLFVENFTRELIASKYFEASSAISEIPLADVVGDYPATNLTPKVLGYVFYDYLDSVSSSCKTLDCIRYVDSLLEYSLNITDGTHSVDELLDAVYVYSNKDLQSAQDTAERLFKKLKILDSLGGHVISASQNLQKSLGSWMNDNCATKSFVLSASENEVTVATCGLVFDCSFESGCLFGLPVVSATKWIPYLPIGFIDNPDALGGLETLGLHYDSRYKVVEAGGFGGCGGNKFLGFGGYFDDLPENQKIYICVVSGSGRRSCKVVYCGLPLEFNDNFNPTVSAETIKSEAGSITGLKISGAFGTY